MVGEPTAPSAEAPGTSTGPPGTTSSATPCQPAPPLIDTGTARPGDLLHDTRGTAQTQTLGGPRATATGALVLARVAVRYGLLRTRPRRTDDPPPPWERTAP
ncbi:hypothetical protein [Streptomyces rhizosphaericus]|uniref:hypothetical protein n=1 Tax=Streptomyces rhizosphaericus TaxID=114699 RepID=UPI00117D0558|nr:hypothetical protein [Streptomyces rhizosphaericus]